MCFQVSDQSLEVMEKAGWSALAGARECNTILVTAERIVEMDKDLLITSFAQVLSKRSGCKSWPSLIVLSSYLFL